jgi:hypothetical protein
VFRAGGNSGLWTAEITHKRTRYVIGTSHDQKFLALKVNKKCKELGIALKNPELEPEAKGVYNVATV